MKGLAIFLLSAMLLCNTVPFLTKESKRDQSRASLIRKKIIGNMYWHPFL